MVSTLSHQLVSSHTWIPAWDDHFHPAEQLHPVNCRARPLFTLWKLSPQTRLPHLSLNWCFFVSFLWLVSSPSIIPSSRNAGGSPDLLNKDGSVLQWRLDELMRWRHRTTPGSKQLLDKQNPNETVDSENAIATNTREIMRHHTYFKLEQSNKVN